MDSNVDFDRKTRKYKAIAAVMRLNQQLQPERTEHSFNESEVDDPSYEALVQHSNQSGVYDFKLEP